MDTDELALCSQLRIQKKQDGNIKEKKIISKYENLLVCPQCEHPLDKSSDTVVCNICSTGWPVKHGIAIFDRRESNPFDE